MSEWVNTEVRDTWQSGVFTVSVQLYDPLVSPC